MPQAPHIKFTFVLFCALLFGCGKKEDTGVKIPGHILSEEVFTKVLTDFALAESAASMNIKNAHFRKIDSTYAFDPLLENKVTQAQYDSTLSFYARQPELYKKVYENVLAALSEIQAKRNTMAKDTGAK